MQEGKAFTLVEVLLSVLGVVIIIKEEEQCIVII